MRATFLAVLFLTTATSIQAQQAYRGTDRQISVALPRLEQEINIDGQLTEAVWKNAALLTGFSQYQPVDGRPAADSTQVFTWYDSHAIYFGIRAFESHGAVSATLADRDKIDNEDYVQVLLDPFNDKRRAWIFGVSALGVQADGIRSETSPGASGPGAGGRFENVDLNPDFVYASKGRVTDYGYEVEVRVPFKSLRYQSVDPQTWAINIQRKVQHSGYTDTWTPAVRANASFLAQSGTLTGLSQLKRGLVLDLNPFVTSKTNGLPSANGWDYETTPEVGGNARWGVTPNLTLDATANPDFSQVESDVAQVTVNERFAVFFPEKRPFFLEGIENFDTPNQLIYMRRIVNPIAGAKLTGKVGANNIAFLSSVDDKPFSLEGGKNPVFNLLRVRRDIGAQSTLGIGFTDRTESSNTFNRVASVDAKLVFAKLYFAQFQYATSFTNFGSGTRNAPMWEAVADRTGRRWGFHYNVLGIGSNFNTLSGYVPRVGIVSPQVANRITFYGSKGALVEQVTSFITQRGVWRYGDFFDAHAPLETNVSVNTFATLRGGWSVTVRPEWVTNAFDEAAYANYAIERLGAKTDTVAFTVPSRLNDIFAFTMSASTPGSWKLSASASATFGSAVAFFEPSRVQQNAYSTSLLWRPTPRIRAQGSYTKLLLDRETDGSRFSTADIPRVKVEYQISRPLFVRFVGQYQSQSRAALIDPLTGFPILTRNTTSQPFRVASATETNSLRTDWLVSYRPTPGTVVFAGYGSGFNGTEGYSLSGLDRTDDGFFFKVSYLFRL